MIFDRSIFSELQNAPEDEGARHVVNADSLRIEYVDLDDPGFLGPDWVITKPRLTGICGSESKQVFFDYASFTSKDRGSGDNSDNPMKNFVSFPHVMGHEVVADVVAVGPEAEGLEVGDRTIVRHFRFGGDRAEVRERSTQSALAMLWNLLNSGDA